MHQAGKLRARWLHAAATLFAVLLFGVVTISPRTPQSDEFVYLGYAYGLAKYGTFTLVTDANGEQPPPTSRISPLVPATHALAMHFSAEFLGEVECMLSQPGRTISPCVHTSVFSHYLQLVLWAACLTWMAMQLARVTGRWMYAHLTTLFIFLSGAPFEYIAQFNSEAIYLPLMLLFLVAFACALTQGMRRYWIVAAVALALSALARPVFFYLFWMLLGVLLVAFAWRWLRSRAQPQAAGALIFVTVFMLIIAPWLARNVWLYGAPTMTVGYSAGTLSYRIAYNEMTNDEFVAGWIYWLPDFGDSLAKRLFEPEAYRRLDLGNPEGIHQAGSRRVMQEIEAKSGAAPGSYTRDAPRAGTGWVLREYIISDWFNHIKVTLLLFWRGVMLNSYFGLVGFGLLLWALAGGLNGPHRPLFLITLGVTTLLSLFYAFISLNIARYSAPMILPMSLAYAALAERWLFNRTT